MRYVYTYIVYMYIYSLDIWYRSCGCGGNINFLCPHTYYEVWLVSIPFWLCALGAVHWAVSSSRSQYVGIAQLHF